MSQKDRISLGEDDSDLRLVRESYALPKDRKTLLTQIEGILSKGKVQKLTVQVGVPIKVERFVPSVEVLSESEEIVVQDLFDAARNAEIRNVESKDGISAWETVARVLALLYTDYRPTAIIVHDAEKFLTWLDHPVRPVEYLFGIAIVEHPEMPEDSILLCGGTDPLDTKTEYQQVAVSFRIPMETKKATKKR